jgi:Family of unknown function (DUF6744)
MQQDKFRTGAFVFIRARGIQPRDPDDLPPLAAQHGIPTDFIPTYAGDRTAIGRAISQASSGLHREGFLLRPITRTSTEVVYGVVREDRDEAEQKLDHDFEATVSWSAEPDPSVIKGDHRIARRVADAYQTLRDKITADDWSSSITSFLETHDAARVRGDGRVYWIPPQRLDDIRSFGALLADVGIDIVLAEICAESRTVVEQVAQNSLDEQLVRLETEVELFDGTQKPSTYQRRLDEYQRLRERAGLYRDALGLGISRAERVLTDLEQKVSTMLNLRRQTVIHREESTTELAAEPTDSKPTIRFAGAEFKLTAETDEELIFASADEFAVASVASLESMGLADRWQSAGQVEVKIHNSGPLGADVTIAIKLPAAQPIEKYAPSLASLGIELAG